MHAPSFIPDLSWYQSKRSKFPFDGVISTSQIIAVLMFCASLFMLWWLGRRPPAADPSVAGDRTDK
jgi:hypothetical protein